jgi:hypothetical protein
VRSSAGLIIAAFVAWVVPAAADAANSSRSHRCDRGLVVVGDSIAAVYKVCGEPSRRVQLQTAQGGGAGERLEYFHDRKVVMITVQQGRVSRIEVVG